jgi:protoheme IX farnesyltransferase
LTPQNIVIGGAAGAFPPMIGWAVATSGISAESVLMFSLIFLWTPPHFWALALFIRGDYENARVPMLTVTHGRRSTRNHIFFYTVVLALFAFLTSFTSLGGWIYLTTAVVLNSIFVKMSFNIWMREEKEAELDNFRVERRFFRFSLIYLFLQFGSILFDLGLGTSFSWSLV